MTQATVKKHNLLLLLTIKKTYYLHFFIIIIIFFLIRRIHAKRYFQPFIRTVKNKSIGKLHCTANYRFGTEEHPARFNVTTVRACRPDNAIHLRKRHKTSPKQPNNHQNLL